MHSSRTQADPAKAAQFGSKLLPTLPVFDTGGRVQTTT